MVSRLLLMLFLSMNTYWDVKKREVRLWSVIAFSIGKMLLMFIEKEALTPERIAGVFPGLLFLCAARLTKESIGYGDGLAVVVCGLYLGFAQTFAVIFYALIFCSLTSALLVAARKWTRKTSVPFLPYLLMGCCCVYFL